MSSEFVHCIYKGVNCYYICIEFTILCILRLMGNIEYVLNIDSAQKLQWKVLLSQGRLSISHCSCWLKTSTSRETECYIEYKKSVTNSVINSSTMLMDDELLLFSLLIGRISLLAFTSA